MPFIILTVLIQAAFVIHIVKTGRNTIWIWVVVLLPMAGSLAYLAVEVLPDLLNSRSARRAASGLRRTFDPEHELRDAHLKLRTTDSIESRRRLADEFYAAGEYAEARSQYRAAMTGLYEHEPVLMLGLARSQFALNEFSAARETLDLLIEKNPDFKSSEGHLLYARTLAEEGNFEKAEDEFKVLVRSYPGAEAKYRYAALLRRMSRPDEARKTLHSLLEDAELSGKHYRRAQKEWLDAARRELA